MKGNKGWARLPTPTTSASNRGVYAPPLADWTGRTVGCSAGAAGTS